MRGARLTSVVSAAHSTTPMAPRIEGQSRALSFMACLLVVEGDQLVPVETIEAGPHRPGIGAHHAHLDPVPFAGVLRQAEGGAEHIVGVAGRAVDLEILEPRVGPSGTLDEPQ